MELNSVDEVRQIGLTTAVSKYGRLPALLSWGPGSVKPVALYCFYAEPDRNNRFSGTANALKYDIVKG